jgi:two-component system, chemotaxis family, sensor kinase CheA
MPKRVEPSRLLDAIAEALILADAGDPASLAHVTAAADAASRSAKRSGAPWADATRVLAAEARKLSSAEKDAVPGMLEELGRRIGRVQALVDAAGAHAGVVAPQDAPRHPSPPDQPSEAPADPPSAEAIPLAGDEELLRDFVSRAMEHLEAADASLLVLERDPSDGESLNGVFRAFHTIKGMAGFLSLEDIERLAHDTESVLDAARKGTKRLDAAAFESVFGAVDAMKALVGRVLGEPAAESPQGGEPTAPVVREQQGSRRADVRVDEARLDQLLDTIGELVIAEAMFSAAAHADSLGGASSHLGRLDKITRELQEMAMSLRMVPLRPTFARMARLVRDTAQKAGKQVDFVTEGADTELDRLVVDRISDPLIHVLRNAVDHGIETAEARRAAGKSSVGRIEIRAFHAGGGIHIEVTDDGAGIDTAAIVEAARRRGMLAEDETPDERRLVDLMFAPGLSTSATVTDVSGRGVGMDVVRRTIESLRGDVEVTSEPGRGTRVAIRLPLTLAIIDGMVVRVGSERYIIPTLSIERSLRPDRDQVSGVLGKGRVVSIDGSLVPLVELGRVFSIETAERDATRGIVVIVGDGMDRVGLVACEILGQQQIVIKSLGEGMRDTQGVAGGAIMPDGQVGLIVDVGGLVKLARS